MLFQSGFQFSPINYDMTCGFLPNHFNLQANMYMADSIARSSLYNMPMFNMGSMMPYGGVSIPGDAIFNYTLNQANYQSLQMGGAGIFGPNGTLNLTGNIFGGGYAGGVANPFASPWANPTPRVDDKDDDKDKEDEVDEAKKEEIKTNRENAKILLEKYKELKADSLSSSLERKINNALGKKGTEEENLEACKEAIKEIGFENIKKILPNLVKFESDLVKSGYDFSNDALDAQFASLHAEDIRAAKVEINTLKNKDSIGPLSSDDTQKIAVLSGIVSNENAKDDILNIISLWNEDDSSPNLISSIQILVKKAEDNEKKSYITQLLDPVCSALTARADGMKNNSNYDLSKEEKDSLDILIGNVTTAQGNVKNNSDSKDYWTQMSKAINELYVALRKIEADRIGEKVEDTYSFLNDIEGFNIDGIIVNETNTDLESENLNADSFIVGGLENAEIDQQINNLISNGKLQEVEIDGKTYYEETCKTEDRNYKRVFVKEDNELKEVKDAKIETKDGKQSIVSASGASDFNPDSAEKTETTAQSIVDDIAEVKSTKSMKEFGTELMNGLYELGVNLDVSVFNNINKDNIIDFLTGVYEAQGITKDGLITKGNRDNKINKDQAIKLIDAMLALIEEKGLTNDMDYKSNVKNLNKIKEKLARKTLNDQGFFDVVNYAGQIDCQLKYIYLKLKKDNKIDING